MHFRVLGPLEVETEAGEPVELGGSRLRALLTLLLAQPGRVVPLDRINERLWGDELPASATGTLQSYVSQLRRLLEPDRPPRAPARLLLTQPPGYRVAVDADHLDLLRFEQLAADGERLLSAGRVEEADDALQAALSLWRGEPFPDLGDDDSAVQADRARLGELQLCCAERHVDAMLMMGRPAAAVADVERLVQAHPLRERLWASLMLALYRSGRQADALGAFHACRTRLDEELGIDPSPDLQALHQSILTHDAALAAVPRPHAEFTAGTADSAPSRSDPANQPPHASPDPTPEDPDDVLVGRETEMHLLSGCIAAARRGRTVAVLVEGEPGIGKTRLAEAAAAGAAADGTQVVWGRCADDLAVPALWPWTQVLRQLADVADAEPPLSPEPGTADDPDRHRVAVFEYVSSRLRAAAAERPLLVVLEDLHGADPTSLQLLTYLAGHLVGARVAIVATLRTAGEERTPALVDTLAALARERSVSRLVIGGLNARDVAELLVLRGASGDAGDAERLARTLHERTDGNPFFLVELVELLRSERRLDSPATGRAADVPRSVRDVIDRRLARLPEDTQTMLRLAAVLGREIDLDVMEAAAGLDAERVISLLEPAVLTGIVLEDTDRWVWRFRHALVQEAIVATLSRLQRARLHRQAAEALESLHEQDTAAYVDMLAHHFHRAGPFAESGKAFHYAVSAARAARDRFAYEQAARYLERALDLLDRGAADHLRRRHELLVELGLDRRLSGDVVGAIVALSEALQVATTLDDWALRESAAVVVGDVTLWNWRPYGFVDEPMVALLEKLLADASQDPDLGRRARLAGTLAVELYYGERQPEGERLAREAVELARETRDVALLGRTLNNLCVATWKPGRDPGRKAATDEALSYVGRGLPRRTEIVARLHRAPLHMRLGNLGAFDADIAATRRLTAELALPELRAQVALQEAGRATYVGDWDVVEARGVQAFELQESSSLWGREWCRIIQRVTVCRMTGWTDDVLDAVVDVSHAEYLNLRPLAILALVEAGQEAGARRLLDRWDYDVPQDWSTDFALACWGEVAAVLGVPDPAKITAELQPYADRLVVAGTANACWGSTHAVLGRLASRTGDRQSAVEHLQAAVRRNRAVGAVPWAERAQALLDGLESS